MIVEVPSTEIIVEDTLDVSVGSCEVEVVDLADLDVTVSKKEYVITGDEIYIPMLYDDAPQWMKDLVQVVVDVAVDSSNQGLVNDLNAIVAGFATSYVPLNQYTQSIVDLSDEDGRLNALIETLNSNFSDGLSSTNAQIVSLQSTKASKDEVVAQVIQTIAAQLADNSSNIGATIGRIDQAIADETSARALSLQTLTASLEDTNLDVAANAEVIQNALAYVGIDEAGASTGTGLSAYLEDSNGNIGGADSELANSIRVTAEGVESKFAYNSIVNINGVYKKSGFGLTTNYVSGNGTQANPYVSEFWIDASRLKFTNSNMTGRTAPFTIDASGVTPQIKFNGIVEFSNVTGTATHTSGTSSPTLGATTAVEGSTYYNTSTKSGYIVSNGSWINNSSVTDTSGLARIDMSNVTTIDGGKITTGSIAANKINTTGLIAENISANEIVGKTIKSSTLESTTINARDIKIITDAGLYTKSVIGAKSIKIINSSTSITFYFELYKYNSTTINKQYFAKSSGNFLNLSGSTLLSAISSPASYNGYICIAYTSIASGTSFSITIDGYTTSIQTPSPGNAITIIHQTGIEFVAFKPAGLNYVGLFASNVSSFSLVNSDNLSITISTSSTFIDGYDFFATGYNI